MSLLKKKFTILEEGVYEAKLVNVTEPVVDKVLVFEWNINGVKTTQQYSNIQVLDDHVERFAQQLGLSGSASIEDLVSQTFKVYVSRRTGDTGASFRNVAPANEPKPEAEDLIEVEI